MERALHLALRDAVDVARARNAELARVVLHGPAAVGDAARAALGEAGFTEVEVVVVVSDGPPRLGAVELSHRADPHRPGGGIARKLS